MNSNNTHPKSYTGDTQFVADFAAPVFRPQSTPAPTPQRTQCAPVPTLPTPENNSLAGLKCTDAIAFNSAAEEKFCALIQELLDAGESITPATIYQEAAFEINISITTAKRYLTKHTARRAAFGIDARGFIFSK